MSFYSQDGGTRHCAAREFVGCGVTLIDGRNVAARTTYTGVVVSVAYGPAEAGVIVLRSDDDIDRAFSLATVASIQMQKATVPFLRSTPRIPGN